MKKSIENILIELVAYGKKDYKKKITRRAYDNMEYDDILNLVSWLLHWQKKIKHNLIELDKQFQEDKFLLSKILHSRFQEFYDFCPELNEVFELKKDRIIYNAHLSLEEIQEILVFIDENHEIQLVRIRRK